MVKYRKKVIVKFTEQKDVDCIYKIMVLLYRGDDDDRKGTDAGGTAIHCPG